MVRPHIFFRLLPPMAALWLLVLLAACASSPLCHVQPREAFTVVYVDNLHLTSNGVTVKANGHWSAEGRVIRMDRQAPPWTLAHELHHAALTDAGVPHELHHSIMGACGT